MGQSCILMRSISPHPPSKDLLSSSVALLTTPSLDPPPRPSRHLKTAAHLEHLTTRLLHSIYTLHQPHSISFVSSTAAPILQKTVDTASTSTVYLSPAAFIARMQKSVAEQQMRYPASLWGLIMDPPTADVNSSGRSATVWVFMRANSPKSWQQGLRREVVYKFKWRRKEVKSLDEEQVEDEAKGWEWYSYDQLNGGGVVIMSDV